MSTCECCGGKVRDIRDNTCNDRYAPAAWLCREDCDLTLADNTARARTEP